MNTKIYIKDKGYLDLYQDINIPLNYSLADVSDISKRNSSFSKTIIIPGSKNNNQILGHIFDININFLDCDFAINRKIEAIIYQNDVPVLTGWFKLLRVNKISPSDISFDQNIEYECVVFSNQAGIFDVIKDLNINDIDLSEGNHILSVDNITASVNNTWREGWKYIWHYTDDSKYKVSDFRPSFYAKKLWDKIFYNAGFTYTSTFLESEPFTKLLIPTNVKDLLISDTEKEARECRVSFTTGYSVNGVNDFTKTPVFGQYSSPIQTGRIPGIANNPRTQIAGNLVDTATTFNRNTVLQLKFNDDSTGVNYDGSYDNYDTTTFFYTAPKTGQYEVDLSLAGEMNVTVANKVYFLDNYDAEDRSYTQSGLPKFDIVAIFGKYNANLPAIQQYQAIGSALYRYNIPTTPEVYSGRTYPTIASGLTTYNYSFNPDKFIVDLNIDEQLFVVFKVITYATMPYSVGGVYTPLQYNFNINGYNINDSFLEINAVKNNLTSGDEIILNDLIPKNIKQVDFIKSFVNMFNLYLIPDEENEKNIIIKTRDEFYADFANDELDWTDKFDYSQEYSITLLSELQQKTLNFTYKQASDEVSKRYREQTGYEYGQFILNFDNDFLTGEKKIEPIFENTPLVKTLLPLGDEGATFIVPYLRFGVETNPKLLYDGGEITVTDYVVQDVDSNGVLTDYTFDYYSYAGHFDNPTSPTFDLNWNVNEVYFYNEVLSNVTLNNLYNLYWYNYVNLISQSKLLTAYFNLNETDILNLNFAKPIWIRDAYYYLNRVIDYNANENGLTKVELIKAIDAPRYNEGYAIVPEYVSDVQTTNPIRPVKGNPLIENVAPGMSSNSNWGYASLVYGNNNQIQSAVKFSKVQGDSNILAISSENIEVQGSDNFIGGNSKSVYIKGSNNEVGAGCNNISLINCNNVKVLDGVSNVSISNASNIIITENGTSIVNPYFVDVQGYHINNSDIVDAGIEIVYEEKANMMYSEMLVDSGESVTYELTEDTDIINGIEDGIQVDFETDIIP